jgi:hypothetical protein
VSSKSFAPTLIIISIILLACLHVWQRVYVIGLVDEVAGYRQDHEKLSDLLKKTNIEIIELSRPSRIKSVAVEKLGLQEPDWGRVYTLKLNDDQDLEPGLDEVVQSFKKLADNLPVLNESRAETIKEIIESDD